MNLIGTRCGQLSQPAQPPDSLIHRTAQMPRVQADAAPDATPLHNCGGRRRRVRAVPGSQATPFPAVAT